MRENLPDSIYLPKKLKEQLVEMAHAADFEVTRGRKSGLARFVEQMLEEYTLFSQSDPLAKSLHSLTPELRSSITRLSKMESTKQERASAMLDLLFAEWQDAEGETQSSESPEQ
jgi:CRISPR/Cas system-associated protein Csm6